MKSAEKDNSQKHVVVVGAGFTGLSAAYELECRGIRTTVLEQTSEIGGMASSFNVGGVPLERFYHHFFPTDSDLIKMTDELGISNRIVKRSTCTGIYVSGNFFNLSSLLDVLRFKPLSLIDRFRLGLLVLKARKYKTWQALDDLTAEEWIRSLCGDEVFRVAWEPLLVGKFGEYATKVSAAWFWGKIAIRGGSRSRTGTEQLAYFKGGFSAIAERMAKNISTVSCSDPVKGVELESGRTTPLL